MDPLINGSPEQMKEYYEIVGAMEGDEDKIEAYNIQLINQGGIKNINNPLPTSSTSSGLDVSRGADPWKGSGTTDVLFGGADYDYYRSQGKTAQEMLDYVDGQLAQGGGSYTRGVNNQPGGGGLYDRIYRDAQAEKQSYSGPTSPPRNTNPSPSPTPPKRDPSPGVNVDNNATVDNSIRGTIGNDNTFGDRAELFNNNSKTNVDQSTNIAANVAQDFLDNYSFNAWNTADVNNSVDVTIGDRNTFGDDAKIGNNNAVTNIDQSFDLNLQDGRSEAKDRSLEWLKVNSFV